MMCEILSLTPAPNNGSHARYEDMLATGTAVPSAHGTISITVLLMLSLLNVII